MKKTLLTIITITLLLLSTVLSVFATGDLQTQVEAGETTAMTNEFGRVVEIPTPVVFGISGVVTLIAAIIIFRKRKIK